MAADRAGNRMGNRTSGDGPLTDPATIRDLNWAALNWAAHYSFLPGSSSPPRAPCFVFPDSVRVSIVRPEGESSERPAFEEIERPGIEESERPGRENSVRLELEKGEHPESERQEIRRSSRKGGSAHPGSEARGLQEVRRTSRKRERARPERETRDLRERERAHPERETRHSRRNREVHPEAAAMARREVGSKIPEKRVIPAIPLHSGDFGESAHGSHDHWVHRASLAGCGMCRTPRCWQKLRAELWSLPSGRAIRAKYGNWTREHWRSTYDFPDTDEDLEPGSKGDTDWVKERFSFLSDHDGFKVADCLNPREQRLLEYVVPILNPEKPTTLTVTLARGILSALHRRKQINWGYLVHRNTQTDGNESREQEGLCACSFPLSLVREERMHHGTGEEEVGDSSYSGGEEPSQAEGSTSGRRSREPARACTATGGEGNGPTGEKGAAEDAPTGQGKHPGGTPEGERRSGAEATGWRQRHSGGGKEEEGGPPGGRPTGWCQAATGGAAGKERGPGGRPTGWGRTSTGGEDKTEGGPGRRPIGGGITATGAEEEEEGRSGSRFQTG